FVQRIVAGTSRRRHGIEQSEFDLSIDNWTIDSRQPKRGGDTDRGALAHRSGPAELTSGPGSTGSRAASDVGSANAAGHAAEVELSAASAAGTDGHGRRRGGGIGRAGSRG